MAKAENENRRDPIHLVWMVKKVPKLDRALGLAGRPYSPCRRGSILLAGTANIPGPSSGYEFALAQFTSNGMPDSSFGDGGTVLDDFDNHDNHATAVALQSDDGILVAGYSDGGSWTWSATCPTARSIRPSPTAVGFRRVPRVPSTSPREPSPAWRSSPTTRSSWAGPSRSTTSIISVSRIQRRWLAR